METFSIHFIISEYAKELFACLQAKGKNSFDCGMERLADAANEVYHLLSFVLEKDKVFLLSHKEYELTASERETFLTCFERRKNGEPLAYIVGRKEFYGYDFLVDNSTLIPRPDTEILVDEAIKFYYFQKDNENTSEKTCAISNFQIVDLGTGTGCILLSVLKECGNACGVGIDINPKAVELARKNAENLGLQEKCAFFTADFTDTNFSEKLELEILHTAKIDCLISNPPYIPDYEYEILDKGVKGYEPKTALVSGNSLAGIQGLYHAEKILALGEKILRKGGLILLEHGYDQGRALRELCSSYAFFEIKTLYDFGNNARALYAIKS